MAPIVIASPWRPDGVLRVQEVTSSGCVMSTGEVLLIRWEKLRALVEQVTQEQAPVVIRTWWTPDGTELIELRRAGAPTTSPSSAAPWSKETSYDPF